MRKHRGGGEVFRAVLWHRRGSGARGWGKANISYLPTLLPRSPGPTGEAAEAQRLLDTARRDAAASKAAEEELRAALPMARSTPTIIHSS